MEERSLGPNITWRWLIQAALGAMLVILLGVHLIVNHWAAPQGLLTHADVVKYYDTPGVVWMEAAFLTVVTAHCLLGLHSILVDLNLKAHITSIITWLLVLAAVGTILYGLWLIRMIAVQST
jgi:succinate dehydrogenase hydrophobic anchor subunit